MYDSCKIVDAVRRTYDNKQSGAQNKKEEKINGEKLCVLATLGGYIMRGISRYDIGFVYKFSYDFISFTFFPISLSSSFTSLMSSSSSFFHLCHFSLRLHVSFHLLLFSLFLQLPCSFLVFFSCAIHIHTPFLYYTKV